MVIIFYNMVLNNDVFQKKNRLKNPNNCTNKKKNVQLFLEVKRGVFDKTIWF